MTTLRKTAGCLALLFASQAKADSIGVDFSSLLTPGTFVNSVTFGDYNLTSDEGFNVVQQFGITELSPVDFAGGVNLTSISAVPFQLTELNMGSASITPVDINFTGSNGDISITTSADELQYGYGLGVIGPVVSWTSTGAYDFGPVFIDSPIPVYEVSTGCVPEPSSLILASMGFAIWIIAWIRRPRLG